MPLRRTLIVGVKLEEGQSKGGRIIFSLVHLRSCNQNFRYLFGKAD
jgi:hypothetical protein